VKPVGPANELVQSTTVSILMMGQVLYLLLQIPRLTLLTPEGVMLTSLWVFQTLMAVHWWYGGLFFLQHLGPARSLPEVYFFFALLGSSMVPALFIHDVALFMGTFSFSFLLAYVRYRTLLPALPQGGVREYVHKKSQVELAGFILLLIGGIQGTLLTEPWLHAGMAVSSVLIQVALIAYCVKRLYPLPEASACGAAPAPSAPVVSMAKAS